MKKRDHYRIVSNNKINENDTYEMILKGDTSAIKNPGEFVEITIPNTFLPRPFSIAYHSERNVYIVYRVVGEGTKVLSEMKINDQVEMLTGLGNGFDLSVATESPLLIGGGTGVAPLYDLAVALRMNGITPTIIMGFRSEADIVYYDEFQNLGIPIYMTLENDKSPADGKLVTDVLSKLEGGYDYFYACGPKGMLKAVCEIANTSGEVSLESRMACGIGQCKCCSTETTEGMKTLCKDGPVLKKELVRW